ncbi:Asp-tRNA(Asn)/Glu-tRNA(Gln) amidotransferase subunit GatB [Candidatus Gromoviella agglomerans]|uniref:Asp-tRNA(Asn)/Glu-tRNA(Gln) amidotransferase subunit GatB n=1 Tax=Candidatus Gromoviella agglomerans TaxID=2806609 RepID=UPI001E4486C6|nr:Asp-tRNA(Asn)/Glu-tRNA(Gln) amidotransferase subunit GatB [Candidatus Gromoviella agglomerans]
MIISSFQFDYEEVGVEEFEMVCGIEIHAQIASDSKLFSRAANEFGCDQNTNVDLFDIAIPGTLPLLNEKCVILAIKSSLALNCDINRRSVFERKHYFYPDLPQGYQISQLRSPIGQKGFVDIISNDGSIKRIGINRLQMEQDAGKSIHDMSNKYSFLDFNRSGAPLMEIVSDPDIRTIHEAIEYIKKIRAILQCVGSSTAKMEEGEFRVDVNMSIRRHGEEFGNRAEIKNLNSLKFIEKAMKYELSRQVTIVRSGEKVVQETRGFDSKSIITFSMREKETAVDYRYFRDVDILPLFLSDDYINDIKKSIPELPDDRVKRFVMDYGLSYDKASLIGTEQYIADFFENSIKGCDSNMIDVVYNWIVGDIFCMMNEKSVNEIPFPSNFLCELAILLRDNVISTKIARDVIQIMWNDLRKPFDIINSLGLQQVNDVDDIRKIVVSVISNNQNEVNDYKNGKDRLLGFFVGQCMKQLNGKANPELLNRIVFEELNK